MVCEAAHYNFGNFVVVLFCFVCVVLSYFGLKVYLISLDFPLKEKCFTWFGLEIASYICGKVQFFLLLNNVF